MTLSAVYVLDGRGKVLISRDYRGDSSLDTIEKFMPLLLENDREEAAAPLLMANGCVFAYIKTGGLYLVGATRKNSNAAMIFAFLHRIAGVMLDYLKELDEESVRDNFVVVYELLDEFMDFGYPQTTDAKILKGYITQEGSKREGRLGIPTALTNAVSWRPEGLRYKKNEVFLDVLEYSNVLVSALGAVLRNEISGMVKMRTFLTGMPELRLGLNDKHLFQSLGRDTSRTVDFDNVKFHHCVRLARFENDRTICFTPPDGEFELMSYKLYTNVKPLIWVEPTIECHKHSRVEYTLKVYSQFKPKSTASNVEIAVPVQPDADSPKFKVTTGNVRYDPERNVFVWTIKSFPGCKEYLLRAHFDLPSVDGEATSARRPIRVKFEIPYFTISGVQVRYLKIIEKGEYRALPWVRYITRNGEYELRTN